MTSRDRPFERVLLGVVLVLVGAAAVLWFAGKSLANQVVSERDEDDSREVRRRQREGAMTDVGPPIAVETRRIDSASSNMRAAPAEPEEPPSQREDVETWIARGDTAQLPALLAIDVAKDLEAAPAVIMGIAKLSLGARPELKKKAAAHLAQMLDSERTRADSRNMRGAAGNVATGIDALGEMATPEASGELMRALDSGKYALHHETRMVQELTKQKYAPARDAVARFAARTKGRVFEDSFDQELQKEALEAADEALTSMGK